MAQRSCPKCGSDRVRSVVETLAESRPAIFARLYGGSSPDAVSRAWVDTRWCDDCGHAEPYRPTLTGPRGG